MPANNALLVDAAPEDFLEVKRLVESLDIMPQQVHISVLIAEIASGDAETLGVAITALNAPDSVGNNAFAGASRLHADSASGDGILSSISQGVFGEGLTFGIAHGSHLDAAGNNYILVGSNLVINGGLVIRNYSKGDLGITLTEIVQPDR